MSDGMALSKMLSCCTDFTKLLTFDNVTDLYKSTVSRFEGKLSVEVK